MNKLSTGFYCDPKKREGKKRKSPFTPYREKGEGKEISPCANRTGLSRARVGAGGGLRRVVASAVAFAAESFGGGADDVRIWASIAWRVGPERFLDAVYQAVSEIRSHARPVSQRLRPRIFQAVLNSRFPKGGAR